MTTPGSTSTWTNSAPARRSVWWREHAAREARAIGNRLRRPARDGQNDRTTAVGRRNWTFAGSDEGGRRAAAVYSLIETCKLNGVDPRAWLADILARLPDHPAHRVAELMPWARKASQETAARVATALAA